MIRYRILIDCELLQEVKWEMDPGMKIQLYLKRRAHRVTGYYRLKFLNN